MPGRSSGPAAGLALLGEFLRKLDAIDTIHEQTRIAMLLVVLTACRKAEVTGGKWSEIDLCGRRLEFVFFQPV